MFGRLINDSSCLLYGCTACTCVSAGKPHRQQIFENYSLTVNIATVELKVNVYTFKMLFKVLLMTGTQSFNLKSS